MQLNRLGRLARRHAFDLLSGFLLLAALLVVLGTFADYGMSWDEPYAVVYGRRALAFFTSFGHDRSATLGINALRGPTFQLLVEAVAALAPEHGLLVRRLITPLVGLVGVAGTWRLARLLGGPIAGLLAAALLLLTPGYYGHMFINPTDLPFAAAYVWSLYFGARLVLELPRPRKRTLLAAGIAFGLTIGLRAGGLVLLPFVLVLLSVRVAGSARTAGDARRELLAALPSLAIVLALGFAAMVAFWPTAWLQPQRILWASAQQAMAYPKHEPVLLAGQTLWSDALPWFYQLAYLCAQLPEQLLLAAAIGAGVLLHALRGAFRAHDGASCVPAGVVLLGAGAPLLGACLLRPVDYDGMRHVLFALPPLACLAAAGVCWSVRRLALRPAACSLLVALLAGSSLHTFAAMRGLHPYEYVYYNPSTGGTSGAQGRYELDYWVTSFGEALGQLGAALAREPAAGTRRQPYRLAVCGHAAVAYMYLPPGVVLTPSSDDADFVLATTKWNCQDRYRGDVVAEVQRAGAPLAVIKRLRPALLTAVSSAR